MDSRYLLNRPSVRDDAETFSIALERYEDDFQQRWPSDDGHRPGWSVQLLPYRIARLVLPRLKPPSYNSVFVDLALQLLFYFPVMALIAWATHAFGLAPGWSKAALAGGVIMGVGMTVLNRLCDVFVPLAPWEEYLKKASRL